jgi:DNA-binding PadR family transcriptional regulator
LSHGPLHGYELKAAYEAQLVSASNLNVGQVYTALDRLERDGLVNHVVVSQAERPDKKVFAITARGRVELQRWIEEVSPHGLDLRNETFLKLVISQKVEGLDPLAVIRREKNACMDRLSEVEGARDEARRTSGDLETHLLLGLAARRLAAFLQWLDDCHEALSEAESKP